MLSFSLEVGSGNSNRGFMFVHQTLETGLSPEPGFVGFLRVRLPSEASDVPNVSSPFTREEPKPADTQESKVKADC